MCAVKLEGGWVAVGEVCELWGEECMCMYQYWCIWSISDPTCLVYEAQVKVHCAWRDCGYIKMHYDRRGNGWSMGLCKRGGATV